MGNARQVDSIELATAPTFPCIIARTAAGAERMTEWLRRKTPVQLRGCIGQNQLTSIGGPSNGHYAGCSC
jgi:hypothetical protein